MKKIAIVLPADLPVPATRGGAVESIMESLINQNEKTPEYEFTVFSAYDERAYIKSRDYKYTKFCFVKVNIKLDELYNLFYRFLKKLFRFPIPDRLARKKMIARLDPKEFDYILYQAGEVFSLKVYAKKLPAEKLLVHGHGMIEPIPSVDKYFGYYLSISDFVADYWRKGSERSSDTYYTWHNCIDTERFSKRLDSGEAQELRKKLGIDANDFVVIFTGRIIPEKGVAELLGALEYIKDKAIKLLIIGSAKFAENSSTPYEGRVSRLVEQNKERVVFTGYIPNDELYKYYSISDAACIPSMWDEPAGLVVLEAMAAGKPIITTASGGIREFADESFAVKVERDESISLKIAEETERLKKNPRLCADMGAAAAEKAKSFDMSAYLRHFGEIIEDISSK